MISYVAPSDATYLEVADGTVRLEAALSLSSRSFELGTNLFDPEQPTIVAKKTPNPPIAIHEMRSGERLINTSDN